MAEVDPSEQLHHSRTQTQTRRAQSYTSLSSVFSLGPESPTHHSLSDSDNASCDLDPIFEPDEDHLLHHHHQFHHHDNQVTYNFNSNSNSKRTSSQNAFISDAAIGLGLGSGSPDPNWRFPDILSNNDNNNEVDLELGLGLGLGLGVDESSPMNDETQRFQGLRVVNIDDSDSDSDHGILPDDFDGDHQGFGGLSDFDRPPYCWDYLGFNNGNRTENVELQEIQEISDAGSTVNDNFDGFYWEDDDIVVVADDDNVGTPIQLDTDVSNVFDTYQLRAEQQDIAIDSETDDGGEFGGVDEAIRDLEWEILLAVNNFNREVFDMDFNVDMYEAILGEVEERMNEWRGSPPAADSVIRNLPSVEFFREGLEEEEVVCAVCKDEVSVEEVVKQLPCLHYYHGGCIVPWLKMRNTCPVCRYELPTDDAEYEYQKREREMEQGLNVDAIANQDLSQDSQVRLDFHVFL